MYNLQYNSNSYIIKTYIIYQNRIQTLLLTLAVTRRMQPDIRNNHASLQSNTFQSLHLKDELLVGPAGTLGTEHLCATRDSLEVADRAFSIALRILVSLHISADLHHPSNSRPVHFWDRALQV